MNKIFYLTHIDFRIDGQSRRVSSPAAETKAKYMAKAMHRTGRAVSIISIAALKEQGKTKYEKALRTQIANGIEGIYVPSISSKHRLVRIFGYLLGRMWLVKYLLQNIEQGDTVVVYHSLYFLWALKYFQIMRLFCRKFSVALEMNEIYGDVQENIQTSTSSKEIKAAQRADGYIFATKLLNERVNIRNRPWAVNMGTYEESALVASPPNDEQIHVIYAGTLDPRKGGALSAVEPAPYLSSNYHIHILGYGTESEIQEIKLEIKRNTLSNHAIVTYDGVLLGNDYTSFLQRCHIGLSTQNPSAKFSSSSFPSKILSYMANNLRIVSIRIAAIENSAVGKDIFFYDEPSPEEIAKAIASIKIDSDYNSRELLKKLDQDFVSSLTKMFEDIKQCSYLKN